MIPYFQRLGQCIERAWLAYSYDEEPFPQLVLDVLRETPPSENVGIHDVIDWIFDPVLAARQPNTRKLFGEPPVLLFQAQRFYIEALFWFSGTTEIHEHSFSGAFTVLAGASVHSHWRFIPRRTINSRMSCGDLKRESTEILQRGAVQPIRSGDRLIHQLFHLEVPSVTIVIRTYEDRHRLPQYRYLPPGLAIDSEDQDPTRTRRLMLLDGMAQGQIGGLREYTSQLIEIGDLETIYYAFTVLTRRKIDHKILDDLYGVAKMQHGEIIDLFRQSCEWERRTRLVVSLRSKISDPEARFLLALLMLMPDRDAVFEAIRLQFPDQEPMAAIEAWLARISGKARIGFDFSDENRLIFRSLVEGLDAEGLLQRLCAEFRKDSVDAHRDRLLSHAKQMANSDLFYPLLSKSPLREELQIS